MNRVERWGLSPVFACDDPLTRLVPLAPNCPNVPAYWDILVTQPRPSTA